MLCFWRKVLVSNLGNVAMSFCIPCPSIYLMYSSLLHMWFFASGMQPRQSFESLYWPSFIGSINIHICLFAWHICLTSESDFGTSHAARKTADNMAKDNIALFILSPYFYFFAQYKNNHCEDYYSNKAHEFFCQQC